MSIRKLFIEKPIASGHSDGLFLYYYHQDRLGTRATNPGFPLVPETDEMLRVYAPDEDDLQVWEWSLGGWATVGLEGLSPQAPDISLYRAWVADYARYNYESNRSRFHGIISEGLTFNLPRFFEEEREKTYRKVLGSSQVKAFLGTFPLFNSDHNSGPPVSWMQVRRDRTQWARQPVGPSYGGNPEVYAHGLLFMQYLEQEIINSSYITNLGVTLGEILGIPDIDGPLMIPLDREYNINSLIQFLVGPSLHERGRQDSTPRTLAPRLVFNALIRLGNIDRRFTAEKLILRAISSSEFQDSTRVNASRQIYSYYKTRQTTPFVGDTYTRSMLHNGLTSPAQESRTDSNYNLYIPSYENSIEPPEIRETSLVNHYAFQIASRAVTPPGELPESGDRVPEGNWVLPQVTPHPPTVAKLTAQFEHLVESLGESNNAEERDMTLPPDATPIREAGINTYRSVMGPLTLGGQIPPESLVRPGRPDDVDQAAQDDAVVPDDISDYYELVSRVIPQDQSSAGNITETIIFPATEGDSLNNYSRNSYMTPMNIEIKFKKGNSSAGASHILVNRRSVGMLCGLSSSASTAVPKPCVLQTDNIIRRVSQFTPDGAASRNRLDPTVVNLSFYDIPSVFTYGADPQQTIRPLLISSRGLESATGLRPFPYYISDHNDVEPEFMSELHGISNAAKKDYNEMLKIAFPSPIDPVTWDSRDLQSSDKYTRSEVVGYKIVKRKLIPNQENRTYDRGPIIQTILFGQTPGGIHSMPESEYITYVDSQIKYGDVYEYSLFSYQFIYGTEYEFFMLGESVPEGLQGAGEESAAARRQSLDYGDAGYNMTPEPVSYRCYTLMRPKLELVEVPIYDKLFYGGDEGGNWHVRRRAARDRARGLAYPPVRVLDSPPPFPDLTVLPLRGEKDKVKLVMNPSAATYEGENALPAIFIPHSGTLRHIPSLDRQMLHQLEYDNPPPKPQYLEGFDNPVHSLNFRSEGPQEIKAIKVYRSTALEHTAPTRAQLYKSFDPVINADTVRTRTLVNTLYNPDAEINDLDGEVGVLSYDMVDNIEPNTTYYYTCVALDAHDNFSTPSQIFEVRLVFDKGLLIPEIKLYEYNPPPRRIPTKKFARFLQIKPSALQSNPFTELDDNGVITSVRNIAAQEGQSAITDNRFIVRLTSRDTGRKFDIELDFNYQDTRLPDDAE